MGIETAMAAAVLVVRLYHALGAGWTDVQAAQTVARDLLQRAGIAVTWIDCAVRADASPLPDRCDRALDANELILRVSSAGPAVDGPTVPMGFSLVHGATAAHTAAPPPVLATVFADRVEHAARDAAVDRHLVLGRAIAHEIGHLLLNHSRHARHGLMRAFWTRDQFRRNRPDEWTFHAGDAKAMRRGLVQRTAPQLAQAALPRPKRS
jgi:hypothetical protein